MLGAKPALSTEKFWFLEAMSSELLKECAEGNLDRVKYLVDRDYPNIPGLGLSCEYGYADTPLHVACRCGHAHVVEFLLSKSGCAVNARNGSEETPLHEVCRNGCYAAANLLIAHSSIHVTDRRNKLRRTPLHLACWNNHVDIVKLLLPLVDVLINVKDSDNNTPLHLACMRYHHDVVKLLLTHRNIQVNVQNKCGDTPLHSACQSHHGLDVIELLLARSEIQVNLQNEHGDTPLHLACWRNHLDIVRLLVSQSAVQAHIHDGDGQTPLHLVCWRNRLDVLKVLLTRSDFQVNHPNRDGVTPLELACLRNNLDALKLLLSHSNIQVNLPNGDGDTPLHLSCQKNHLDVVKQLLGHNDTQVNLPNRDGDTPLHIASRRCHVEIVKTLLSTGKACADPTYRNLSNQTPIDVTNDYEIIRILLSVIMSKTDHPIDSYVKVFVVGDSGAGKSTLVSALCEDASSLRKLLPSQYRRAKGVEAHTAGINPLQFCSSRFGNVILYDFAGHLEYHSSHSAVLENTITSSTPVFIVVVDVSVHPDEITANLHRWLLFIDNHTTRAATPPHTVVVGSHIDEVKSRDEKSAAIAKALCTASASIGHILHDCRDTACSDLDQLSSLLAQYCSVIRESSRVDLRCHVLYAFLLAKFPDNAACRVRDIIGKVTEDDSGIPRDLETLFTLLKSLSDKGQVLLLQSSKDPAECFVVLKMTELLHEVNGTLFAPQNFKQHKDFANSTGLSPRTRIKAVFPLYDPNMIIGYLEQMEFCRKIKDVITVVQCAGGHSTESLDPTEEYYFFPALIQEESPQGVWEENDAMEYQFGWCLQCSKPSHYLSSRFVHVLLLRLAFSFAFPREPHEEEQTSPVLTRCCSVWKNGIQWLELAGIETIVEVREHGTVVMVMMQCKNNALVKFAHLRSSILKTILDIKQQLCPKTITRECLVDPSDLCYPPMDASKITLYGLPRVAEALLTSQLNSIDHYGKKMIEVDTLLSFEPLRILDLSEDVLRELFVTQQPSDTQLKSFLARHVPQSTQLPTQSAIQENFLLSARSLNKIFQESTRSGIPFIQKLFEAWSLHQKPAFREVVQLLVAEYSILCGRDLLVSEHFNW